MLIKGCFGFKPEKTVMLRQIKGSSWHLLPWGKVFMSIDSRFLPRSKSVLICSSLISLRLWRRKINSCFLNWYMRKEVTSTWYWWALKDQVNIHNYIKIGLGMKQTRFIHVSFSFMWTNTWMLSGKKQKGNRYWAVDGNFVHCTSHHQWGKFK